MKMWIRQHKTSLTAITAMLVLLIAVLAGSSLEILRGVQRQQASASAAMTVVELGRLMAAHLGDQSIVTSLDQPESSWSSFSSQVRSLCAMEQGLQYVSVIRDGITLFHEQRESIGSTRQVWNEQMLQAVGSVKLDRKLLGVGSESVPVVIFTRDVLGADGKKTTVEVAIRRDTVERERMPAEFAIAKMFKVALATIVISFSVCILLVVWMMRREHLRELSRREEEHLVFAGVMANGIVHDFRNPMSSLKLDVQMMMKELEKEGGCNTDKVRKLAERSRKTVDRMDKVFDEFLYVSKPPSEERELIDLCGCIKECLAILEPRMQKSGVSVIMSVPEAPVNILVYHASFNRAVMNIILNAEQHSPEGKGVIEIRVSCSGRNAVLEVMDNGPGIKSSEKDVIFEMFQSGRPGGTGLGLFFARTAIEKSEGIISVSNQENGGACFKIEVPLDGEKNV